MNNLLEVAAGAGVDRQEEVPAVTSKKAKKASNLKPLLCGKPVKRQRKLTSTVWDDFELIDELDVNGNMQCKCKRCGVKYIAESSHGTGNMLRHRKSCKEKHYRDIGHLILQSNLNGSLESKSPRFNQDEFRELVGIAIARHNLPLQLVEYDGIRSIFAYLNSKRIMSITLDNASNNDSMVDGLKFDLDLMSNGDYFHARCCAHILNLIVQDGLKEIDGAVFKVRECVAYCKGSQSRKQRFKHCVQHVGIESTRRLKQDVPTRWNSTFHMLDSALFYKKALLHLAKTDANFVRCPTSDAWAKIEKICKFLQVFHEVTVKFSGSKYPTSNLYFPNVFKIRLLLKIEMECNEKFLKNIAEKMNLKFDKYRRDFSTIMGIAVVFDPHYKFQDFDDFSSYEFTANGKSKLQSYLEEPKLPRVDDFDVLECNDPDFVLRVLGLGGVGPKSPCL
ncbi:hypothetical protein OSB04_019779 [Centaurea solstitialis]|uniref:hAT-like transposase RNase-H fold domain-containing protein n=1 Tax=Centaurea solstitialis TaxID=347529 RepID=A0AA38WG76_9ASTR|nr:hypothetical protein OSB04_019779 [Centaurea solstitialis]